MDKEKQIEEIAKAMCKNYGNCNRCIAFVTCDVKSFALRLHEKGYRKERQGEWVDRYGNKYDNHIYDCSLCNKEALWNIVADELLSPKTIQVLSDYCPNCGAKMKGAE